MQNNCAVSITNHQSLKRCQHFVLFLLVIFLQICQVTQTIKKFVQCVALKVSRRKVFKIKEFADNLLFLIYQ